MDMSEQSPALTGWMPAHVRPVRPGWYERHYIDGIYRHYWDGAVWRFSPDSKAHWRQCDLEYPKWRGLAHPADDDAQWVGFTEDELFWASWQENKSFLDGVKWADAKLKEKNT